MNNSKHRLLFAAVMVAVLLVVAAGPPPRATPFTGTETCVDVPGTGTFMVVDGKLHIKGLIDECTDVTSDPRLSGTDTVVINAVFDPATNLSGPMWGTYRIENAGGVWEGQWVGKRTTDGFSHIWARARGSGGYKGLHSVAYFERLSPNPADPMTIRGYILHPGE
jgi:hypothetical protein